MDSKVVQEEQSDMTIVFLKKSVTLEITPQILDADVMFVALHGSEHLVIANPHMVNKCLMNLIYLH